MKKYWNLNTFLILFGLIIAGLLIYDTFLRQVAPWCYPDFEQRAPTTGYCDVNYELQDRRVVSNQNNACHIKSIQPKCNHYLPGFSTQQECWLRCKPFVVWVYNYFADVFTKLSE